MPGPVRRVAGSIVVTVSGSAVTLATHSLIVAADEVLSIIFQNPSTNKGAVYTGSEGSISAKDSWAIQLNEQTPPETFRNVLAAGGFVQAREIFFDSEFSGDRVNFIAILNKQG